MPRFLFIVIPFLAACATEGDACDLAMDARTACMDQAGLPYETAQVDQARAACSALLFAEPDLQEFVTCQQIVFEEADCADAQAAQAAQLASEDCEAPF